MRRGASSRTGLVARPYNALPRWQTGVTLAIGAATLPSMNLPPDDQPPPAKPPLTYADRRARHEDRLTTIRLRMAIWRALDEGGITTPAAVGEALGMPPAEAVKLMTGRQWREGDVARLGAAAARLGVQVPPTPRIGTHGDD
jgi:hypothetical protein